MANFHTFTDFDGLTQDASMAYGPVNTDPENKYRVTSMFTSSVNRKAYAVVKGLVFLQKTSNTDLCNLILKPLEQHNIDCKPVKYFIYRGLRLDNFKDLAAATEELYLRTEGGIPDILLKMYEDWSEQDDNIALTDSSLRLDLTSSNYPDEKLIDDVFLEDNDNQLPVVEAGDILGVFSNIDPFGFEIILDDFGYYPTMAVARCIENIIIPSSTGNKMTDRNSREVILAYIDPAAYYGLFYSKKIVYHTTINNDGSPINDDDIYSNVLIQFHSNNKIYIDIRNENNHSLNFYDNYGISSGDAAQIIIEYFKPGTSNKLTKDYNTNKWPILILDNTIPDNYTTHISLQFKLKDNYYPVLYSPHEAILTNDEKHNLFFIPLYRDDVDWDFTKASSFKLKIPAFEISGENTPISYYYNISFNRQFDDEYIEEQVDLNNTVDLKFRDVPLKTGFIDNLLCPFSIKAPWKNDVNPAASSNVHWIITHDDKFDGWNSIDGIYRTFHQGVANDHIGETAFVLFKRITVLKERNGKYKNNEIKTGLIDDLGFTGYESADLQKSFFEIYYDNQRRILSAKTMTDEQDKNLLQKLINTTEFEIEDHNFYDIITQDYINIKIPRINPPHEQLTDIEAGDMISLSYSYNDKSAIITKINDELFDKSLPIFFFFKEKDEIALSDEDTKQIFVRELWLRGFLTNGDMYEVSTEIDFYSINNYYYFTKLYTAGF